VAPYGKKTTSGIMLGCVIFFPLLAHVVNQGVRRGAEHPLRCVDCVAGGVTGGGPTYGFVHGFLHMVLDVMVFGPWYWMLRHV